MSSKNNKLSFLIMIFLFSYGVHAQDGGGSGLGSAVTYEFGVHTGNILPNQIDGVTEVTSLWGIRGGWRTSKKSFIELGAMTGKESGSTISNIHLSSRTEMQLDRSLFTQVFVGLDTTITQAEGSDKETDGGMHLGGGIMNHISEEMWLRVDMKYNFNPGTSLYFGVGLMMRFAGGGGGGGE